jgi:lysophospholipid acyltransferase (LPLAT)-like uncharacterized protein
MSWLKRVLRDDRMQGVAAWAIAGYIRLAHRTIRWDYVGLEHLAGLRSRGFPVLACFWHGRFMMIRFLWREERRFSVLISTHRDGRLIARSIERLDVAAIAGSSRRGGAPALLQIIRTLKDGGGVGITPDGPKGPRMRAKPGIAAAARAAGVPILPVTYSVRRRVVLGSWDRFVVALPFARGVYVIGEPIDPEESDDETVRQLVETRLNDITRQADHLAGVAPIEPAPLASSRARA